MGGSQLFLEAIFDWGESGKNICPKYTEFWKTWKRRFGGLVATGKFHSALNFLASHLSPSPNYKNKWSQSEASAPWPIEDCMQRSLVWFLHPCQWYIDWVLLKDLFSCPWNGLFCKLSGVCCLLEELLSFSPVDLVWIVVGRESFLEGQHWHVRDCQGQSFLQIPAKDSRLETEWNTYTNCPESSLLGQVPGLKYFGWNAGSLADSTC